MDEICFALSTKINSLSCGKYVIFYEDELIEVMPDGEKNRDTLEAALKKLMSSGCIDVKYARNSAFCIASKKPFTPTACLQKPAEDNKPIGGARAILVTAASAFAGSALSSAIVAIIFALATR